MKRTIRKARRRHLRYDSKRKLKELKPSKNDIFAESTALMTARRTENKLLVGTCHDECDKLVAGT
jgi:hypothetical protein